MTPNNLLKGSRFADERGVLNFFNSFEMNEIVRMYDIAPASTQTIRAWQGHQNEKKWFYCNSGAFIVNLFKLDNFENPSVDLVAERHELIAENPMILAVPGGFANGFKAYKENSKLIVFSNFTLEESKADNFRFPLEQWHAEW